MGKAFLFDPGARGVYGDWARDLLFGAGYLQRSGEITQLRVGDLLYYNLPADKIPHDEIVSRLDLSNRHPELLRRPLDQALWKHRIHVIYADHLSDEVALDLHATLCNEPDYLGCYGVDTTLGLHQWLFELKLILNYRVAGSECWTRYEDEVEWLERLGFFKSVLYVPVFDQEFVPE